MFSLTVDFIFWNFFLFIFGYLLSQNLIFLVFNFVAVISSNLKKHKKNNIIINIKVNIYLFLFFIQNSEIISKINKERERGTYKSRICDDVRYTTYIQL